MKNDIHDYLAKSQLIDELIDSLSIIKEIRSTGREDILASLEDEFWRCADKIKILSGNSLNSYIPNKDEKIVKNTLAIFFETDFAYEDFIKNVFLPLSQNLKKHLVNASFHILKYEKHISKQIGTLLVYRFSSQQEAKKSSAIIKRYLFEKVTELQLDRIHILTTAELFVYYNKYGSENEFNIFSETSNILTCYNSEESLSANMCLTYFIYFYLLSGLYYYSNIKVFLGKNEKIFKYFLTGSSISISSVLYDTIKHEDLEDKLKGEYSSIYYSLYDEIKENYHDLLSEGVNENSSFNHLKELQNIYSLIEYDKDSFFVEFIEKSFDFFFIDKYYKGLIPYMIKKYSDEIF